MKKTFLILTTIVVSLLFSTSAFAERKVIQINSFDDLRTEVPESLKRLKVFHQCAMTAPLQATRNKCSAQFKAELEIQSRLSKVVFKVVDKSNEIISEEISKMRKTLTEQSELITYANKELNDYIEQRDNRFVGP